MPPISRSACAAKWTLTLSSFAVVDRNLKTFANAALFPSCEQMVLAQVNRMSAKALRNSQGRGILSGSPSARPATRNPVGGSTCCVPTSSELSRDLRRGRGLLIDAGRHANGYTSRLGPRFGLRTINQDAPIAQGWSGCRPTQTRCQQQLLPVDALQVAERGTLRKMGALLNTV